MKGVEKDWRLIKRQGKVRKWKHSALLIPVELGKEIMVQKEKLKRKATR